MHAHRTVSDIGIEKWNDFASLSLLDSGLGQGKGEGGGGKGKKSGEKMGARIERLLPLGAIVVVVVVAVTGGDAFSTTESLPYRSLLFSDRESVTGRNYLPTCSSLFILASLLLLLEAKRNLAPSRRKGANPSLSLPFSFRFD